MEFTTICLNPVIKVRLTDNKPFNNKTPIWRIEVQFNLNNQNEPIILGHIKGTEAEAIDYAEETLGVSLNGNNQDRFLKEYFREELKSRGYDGTNEETNQVFDEIMADEWTLEHFYDGINDAIRTVMAGKNEYKVEIHNNLGFVSQLDVFNSEEDAKMFRKGYEAAHTLQKDERIGIVTVFYDKLGNETGAKIEF